MMPTYLYKCSECGECGEVFHRAGASIITRCNRCDGIMNRSPIAVAVNWNGPKPSDGGITPLVRNMIADAPRQRDEMQARKEDDND